MTTIFALLFSLTMISTSAPSSDLTFGPADAITLTLSTPPAEQTLESAADIEDVYPDLIKIPRGAKAPRPAPAPATDRTWTPHEKLPASTYLYVRPSPPMVYGR